jgi:deoxyhypusine synthase
LKQKSVSDSILVQRCTDYLVTTGARDAHKSHTSRGSNFQCSSCHLDPANLKWMSTSYYYYIITLNHEAASDY